MWPGGEGYDDGGFGAVDDTGAGAPESGVSRESARTGQAGGDHGRPHARLAAAPGFYAAPRRASAHEGALPRGVRSDSAPATGLVGGR
jgi:hypothetical protein